MMTRVVAQSALLTAPTHGHGLSKEIGKPKGSVKMAYGLQTPVRSHSICLGNKMVRFCQDPIKWSGTRCVDEGAKFKFKGFTEEALEAIMLARHESRRLGEDSIEADHILLGLIGGDTGNGIAAEALKSMGIKFRDVREYVIKKIISISLRRTTGLCFEFMSIATDILILSFEEARKLGHNYIGPEHLLLGLLRQGSATALWNLGFDLSSIRTQVLGMVGEGHKLSVQGIGADMMQSPPKVPEPSVEATMVTLRGLKEQYEIHHKLRYQDTALLTAAELSDQYIRDGFLPDKAIDLFDQTGALVSACHAEILEAVKELRREFRQIIKSKKEAGRCLDLDKLRELHNRETELRIQIHIFDKMSQARKIVKEVDFEGMVSSRTGIPIEKLEIDESDRQRKMEETLHKRVIGQDEAVKAVSCSTYHSRFNITSSHPYPIACFVLYGPAGVGKSDLAKALAAYYFGSEEAVIQLDMREFMESHTVSKLIGSSPKNGQLTEAVRRRPHTVVLLEEFDKAHLYVLETIHHIIFHGVLGGVDFRNTLLIMTSNAGSSVIDKGERRLMGFDLDEHYRYNRIKSLVKEELKQWFGPIFVSPINEVIVFRHLTKSELKEIADIKLKGVLDRFKAKGIQLHVTERFRESVVEQGYDSNYGARPLKAAITHLQDSMAEKMVAKEIKEGDSVTVDVDSHGNAVILNGCSSGSL
ncbi:hypothetical protein V6N13_028409 [Hibiscus sabdariffa]|uniref:Clp R domain-containing protein n=1 Tax=Hibiscus sabdariffa TaxID=183260 RepID=A0ABR2DAH2_9ROSI